MPNVGQGVAQGIQFEACLGGTRLSSPVDFLPWPDGGWIVAARAGQGGWRRTDQTPRVLPDLQSEIGILNYERGLLSLALDPYFAEAPFIYAYYAHRRTSRLSRFSVVDGLIRRESGSALLEMASKTSGRHFGGGLRFGPDGLLYPGAGETGWTLNASAPFQDAMLADPCAQSACLITGHRQGEVGLPHASSPDAPSAAASA